MSTPGSRADSTSWKLKNTRRPLLRMPLAQPFSSSFTTTPMPMPNAASEEQARAYLWQQSSAPPSSSSASGVSSLPIPSLDGRRAHTKTNATPPAERAAAWSEEDVNVNVQVQQQHRPLDAPLDSSAAKSASAIANEEEENMRERLRLSEAEHDALRHSLRDRMRQATNRFSSAVTAQPAPPSSSSSSSRSSREVRDDPSNASSSSTSASGGHRERKNGAVDSALGGPVRSGLSSQQPLVSTQAATLPPGEAQRSRLNRAQQFSAAITDKGQFSPPPKKPVDVPSTVKEVADEQSALPFAYRAPPPPPQPAQQQQQGTMDASHPHCHHQPVLNQLRHDLQSCAHEIERLVEDQYDLRCSVRDALLDMSRADVLKHGAAVVAAVSVPSPASEPPSSHTDAHPAPSQVNSQVTANNSGDSLGRSPQLKTNGNSAPALLPPPWLLPWLQQLRSEQDDNFQRLREEMVVMICHAVAEVRHASRLSQDYRKRSKSSSSSSGGEESRSEVRTSSPPRQGVGKAAPFVPTHNNLVELDTHSLVQRSERVEEPPPSLLWQRYRRLMSPTPPHPSSVMSSTSASGMSLQGQDALWTALLHIQRVVDAQSAHIAHLTEQMRSVPSPETAVLQHVQTCPPKQQEQQRQHLRPPAQHPRRRREPSITSTDTMTTSVDTRSCSTTSSSSLHHHHRRSHPRHTSPPSHHVAKCKSPHETAHGRRSHRSARPPPSPASASSSAAPPPKAAQRRSSQLDAIQDEMNNLRHLLRETLQRDRQLAQRAPATPLNTHSYESHRYPEWQEQYRDVSSVDDSDVRSSRYAQRGYVAAHEPPLAHTSQRPSSRPGLYVHGSGGVGRPLPTEDTRYARRVVPSQHRNMWPANTRAMPPQAYTPSPSASPIDEEWMGEDIYTDGAAEALETPPQLSRQRVRTTLTSSLVYPHV
jgi:hypothetical protein